MKISKRCLENAKQLRDAALRIVSRFGHEVLIGESNERDFHRCKEAKVNDLTILVSQPDRDRRLDVWQSQRGKVFSIAWDSQRPAYVLAFAADGWQNSLRRADSELTSSSIRSSSQLKKWLMDSETPGH